MRDKAMCNRIGMDSEWIGNSAKSRCGHASVGPKLCSPNLTGLQRPSRRACPHTRTNCGQAALTIVTGLKATTTQLTPRVRTAKGAIRERCEEAAALAEAMEAQTIPSDGQAILFPVRT